MLLCNEVAKCSALLKVLYKFLLLLWLYIHIGPPENEIRISHANIYYCEIIVRVFLFIGQIHAGFITTHKAVILNASLVHKFYVRTTEVMHADRLVLRKWKSDHVTPLLEKLHWLPVEDHIHYKIATLAFRHFESSLPLYLSKLLHTYQPSQTLRSSSELLKVPKTNLKSAENCSFHFQAAKI